MIWITFFLVVFVGFHCGNTRIELERLKVDFDSLKKSIKDPYSDEGIRGDIEQMQADIGLLSANQRTIAYQLKQKFGYWIDL